MDILVFSAGMKLLVGLLCDCFWICLCWSWCSCWGWNWGKPAFYQGWGPHYNLKASQLSTMTRTSKGVVASVDFVPCFFFFFLTSLSEGTRKQKDRMNLWSNYSINTVQALKSWPWRAWRWVWGSPVFCKGRAGCLQTLLIQRHDYFSESL